MLMNMFCKRCGIVVPIIWNAHDKLWNLVNDPLWPQWIEGEDIEGYNVLCPSCFTTLSRYAGLSLIWMPYVDINSSLSSVVDELDLLEQNTAADIAERVLPCLYLSQACDPDVNGYIDHSGECPAAWRSEVAAAIINERKRSYYVVQGKEE